jgi:hypothetical protein
VTPVPTCRTRWRSRNDDPIRLRRRAPTAEDDPMTMTRDQACWRGFGASGRSGEAFRPSRRPAGRRSYGQDHAGSLNATVPMRPARRSGSASEMPMSTPRTSGRRCGPDSWVGLVECRSVPGAGLRLPPDLKVLAAERGACRLRRFPYVQSATDHRRAGVSRDPNADLIDHQTGTEADEAAVHRYDLPGGRPAGCRDALPGVAGHLEHTERNALAASRAGGCRPGSRRRRANRGPGVGRRGWRRLCVVGFAAAQQHGAGQPDRQPQPPGAARCPSPHPPRHVGIVPPGTVPKPLRASGRERGQCRVVAGVMPASGKPTP